MFESIYSFKSAFPYFFGCRPNYTSKAYRSLVRSKLDYGCIIYGSARKSYLQMLDPIHNQGLRLALGAFRTSPVASLYVEADEPSVYSRREKLSLQYAIRLAANPSNPIDYGCIIYGSARKSYLQMLDPIHNQGLRLALWAFRTSPVASLYVEADEPSLYSRREKLSLQYAIRLAANPSNPAHEVTFPPNYVNLYEQKPKAIKSFGIRISPLLKSANIKQQNIEKTFYTKYSSLVYENT